MSDPSRRIQVGDRIVISTRGKKKIYVAEFSHAGQHCRQSLKTQNLKIAKQRAVALESQLVAGTLESKRQAVQLCEAIKLYTTHLTTEGRRPKTIQKYSSFLATFERFARDHKALRIDQVTIELVDSFRAVRKPTHSKKSMHNEGIMLKGFLNWCTARAMLAKNPIASMKFKRPLLTPRGGPTLDQINQILAATSGIRRVQLSVLAFSGMRLGELQRLRPDDLDLDGNWLHIISRDGNETKTGHSRKVPIHPRLRKLLELLPKKKRAWLFTAPASKKFPGGENWINAKRLNESLVALLTKLGMPAGRHGGFTVHSFRHSFKAICVNAGVPERAIDCWLGHRADQSVRAAYYLLSDEESQRFMRQVPFSGGEPAADAGI